jgi:hypothetical protein
MAKNEDLRCQFLVSKCSGKAEVAGTTELATEGFVPLGIALFSFDLGNFKTQRVLVHHVSVLHDDLLMHFLGLLETEIYTRFDRPIDEVFIKLKHKKEGAEYMPVPRPFIERLKGVGWKWKMVNNETDARYTIFWTKRNPQTHGEAHSKCVEPFRFIFCGFISDDPDLVFLNKREINPESFLCAELMSYFGRVYQEHCDNGGKSSENKSIRSSILIKSQAEGFYVPPSQEEPISTNRPPKTSTEIGIDNINSSDALLKTLNTSIKEGEEVDDSHRSSPPRNTNPDDPILSEYTERLPLDNSRSLVAEIERIFDSKLRDKHLKKIHFQTGLLHRSLLSTFRLALRLPAVARTHDTIGSVSYRFIRLNYLCRLASPNLSEHVYLINSLDPNFKLLILRADSSSCEIGLQESLRNLVNTFEDPVVHPEEPDNSGHIWIPQCKRASIFEYVGCQSKRQTFCKFEVQMSLSMSDDAVTPAAGPEDIRLKGDFVTGILRIDSHTGRLGLLASFRMAKTNFWSV